ncbi:MAG: hypothetical protein R6X21_05980 [Candidatus Aminicenantes bacterium]
MSVVLQELRILKKSAGGPNVTLSISSGEVPISREASLELIESVTFGPPADFFKIHNS